MKGRESRYGHGDVLAVSGYHNFTRSEKPLRPRLGRQVTPK
jgi:hypothetical protein